MMNSVMQLKTDSNIVRGDAGLKACDQTDILRKDQIDRCTSLRNECQDKKESFTTSQGKKIELPCAIVEPESSLWSDDARKRKLMCKTIDTDLTKCLGAMLNQRLACQKVTSQLEAYSGQTREQRTANTKLQNADARACGIAGCGIDENGELYKKSLAQPASLPTPVPQPNPGNTPSWAEEPQYNSKITLTTPDARACGLWGCLRVGNVYHPIVK